MNICDWFDIYNIEHVKAYRHMQNTGSWPDYFLPEDVTFPPQWSMVLRSILADEWIKYMLGEVRKPYGKS